MNSLKFLTDAERLHLETTMRERLETDTRNAALLLFSLHTGARAEEVLGVQWQDLNLESGTVLIRTLKGGENRELPLPRWILKPLSILKTSSPLKPFDLSYNRFGEIWREYRPCVKPLHSLRHTFAMRLYERRKDIRLVQYALGHRNIQNTMIYANYSYSVSELRKAIGMR